MLNRTYVTVIGGLLSLLLLTSCNDNPSSFSDTPPQLPASSSMQMEFSSFDFNRKATGGQVQTVNNYAKAVGVAVTLNNIVKLNLAIPHALYTAAEEIEPEFTDDGNWEWSYSHTAGGESYSVLLKASRTSSSSVNWDFYVSNSQLGLSQQLFFSGQSNVDGTEGTWNYYSLDDASSEAALSTVEWQVDQNEDKELQLEVLDGNSDYQGDYIEYSYDGTIKQITYFDSSESSSTELQINTETQAGYLKAPNYNEGEKACWNENRQDTPCS